MVELNEWLKLIKERASRAINKQSAYGPDIDIEKLTSKKVAAAAEIELKRVEDVGIDLERAERTAFYMQLDDSIIKVQSRLPGVEIRPLHDFILSNFEDAREYVWKIVRPDVDKYTAIAALRGTGGYFVRVKPGVKVEDPIQTCFYMAGKIIQAPHNVIVLEEGAEATIITGCTIMPEVAGLHAGITEVYVKEGARLNYVMVHAWNKVAHVRPRSAVRLYENAEVVSYYMNLSSVRTLQMYPQYYIVGSGGKVYSASIVLGRADSILDVGAEVVLESDGIAEVISRFIVRDKAKAWARAKITGNAGKGHIECKGLILSRQAELYSVPELGGIGAGAMLTHEASIGKVAEEEILYLMSKGFTREEAEEMIVRGFMNVEVRGVTPKIKAYITNILKLMSKRSLSG